MAGTRASPANAWGEPHGLGRLCAVAAAAISPGRREPSLSVSSRSCVEDEAEDTTERGGPEFRVVEVDAFASVHDMIHAAIASYGKQATLREIYKGCQQRGRIAYKRSGGSRLITHNDHWKSQIRHALYTCDRAADAHDLWTVSAAFSRARPQTTKVLIRTDPDAASVNDDSADAQRRQGKQASRQTRSKHTLEEPLLQGTPKQKRSSAAEMGKETEEAGGDMYRPVVCLRHVRTARTPAKTASPGSSVATRSRADFLDNHSGSIALSNGQNNVRSASEFSDMGDRAASAFQPYSYDASTPGQQHEGEDESSHNDACMQVMPQIYLHDGMLTSFEPGLVVQPSGVVHHGCASLPIVDVHPYFTECLDAHQIVASATLVRSQPNHSHSPSPNMHSNQPFVFAPHRSPPLSPQPPPHHHQHTPHHYQHSPHQHSLSRTLSAEAESPAETQVYSLRSRLAPRVPAEPSGLQQTHDQLQRPVHKVHHFFTCHTEQPGQASQPSPGSPHQRSIRGDSSMLSMPGSPMSRATARQGNDAGKPPALPRGGRTQLLLAAARKAQTAAFLTADPGSSEPAQPIMSQAATPPEGPSGPGETPNSTNNEKAAQGGSLDQNHYASSDSVAGRFLRSKRFISSNGL